MKKTELITKEIEFTVDLICNKCGKTLKQELTTDGDIFNYCGLEEVKMECGYGSENDGTVFVFSLCEKCVMELMKSFKIPAHKEVWGEIKVY